MDRGIGHIIGLVAGTALREISLQAAQDYDCVRGNMKGVDNATQGTAEDRVFL
jgi:hypothetical protein